MRYQDIDIFKYKQSGFRIEWQGRVVYIDPFQIPNGEPKADVLFITHDHFDHFDLTSIGQIIKDDTDVIGPKSVAELMHANFSSFHFHYAFPGGFKKLDESEEVMDIRYCVMPAYNVNKTDEQGKAFHSKENNWVGYIMQFGDTTVYHMGDSDFVLEMREVSAIDLCLVPISGTYVMTPGEAANAVNQIKPKVAIPMHHDAGIIGGVSQVEEFKKLAKCEVISVTL